MKKRRGLDKCFKEYIDNCFETDFEMTAKKCCVKMYAHFAENINLPELKQVCIRFLLFVCILAYAN